MRRPRVRGTAVLVLDGAGRVLLVRHTYGDRARWDLPGGWVHDGEDPMVGARREVLEELGIELELRPLGVLDGDWDFKREELAFFEGDWPGGRGRYDAVELAEVAWFALDALPEHTGAATRAVLEERRARRGGSGGS